MTKKYIVKNTTLYTNGKAYGTGAIVELDESVAEKLKDVLKPAPADKQTNKNNKNQNNNNGENGGKDDK